MKIGGIAARVAVISAVATILGIGLCTATWMTTQDGNHQRELAAGGAGAAVLALLGLVGLVVAFVMAIVASLRPVRFEPGPRMPFPPASSSMPGTTTAPPPMVAPLPLPTQDRGETDHER